MDDEQFGFLVAGLGAISRWQAAGQIPAMADEKAWKEVRRQVPKPTLPADALIEDLAADCEKRGITGPKERG
ncbi:MAG: hypothetical protein ABID40_04135 [Candidatus Bipolaricaulota bacterium]